MADEKNTAVAPTAQQFTELQGIVTKQASDLESLTKQFTESETARTAAETKATEAETRVKALEDDKRRQSYTDEVMGRSAANNIRWFGDIDKHVEILEAMPDASRQTYIDQQRETAKRMTALLGKEIGSDAPGEIGEGSAWAAVEAEAAKLMATDSNLTSAVAISKTLKAHPDLHQKYNQELRTRR